MTVYSEDLRMFTSASFNRDSFDQDDFSNTSFDGGQRNPPSPGGPLTPEVVSFLSPQELSEAARVYAECFSKSPWNELWTVQEAQQQIEAYLQSGADVIVVRDAGVITGIIVGMPLSSYSGKDDLAPFAGASTDYYYIADFAVDPGMQGRGVGKGLMAALDRLAWASGVDAIITRTRSDNTAALNLFRRSGFQDKGVYEAATGGITSERTVLEKISQ